MNDNRLLYITVELVWHLSVYLTWILVQWQLLENEDIVGGAEKLIRFIEVFGIFWLTH